MNSINKILTWFFFVFLTAALTAAYAEHKGGGGDSHQGSEHQAQPAPNRGMELHGAQSDEHHDEHHNQRRGDRDRDRDWNFGLGLFGGTPYPYSPPYGYADPYQGSYYQDYQGPMDPYDAGYNDGFVAGQSDRINGYTYNPRQVERSGNSNYFEGFVAGYRAGWTS
jgi:hypothetical protein